MSGVSLISSNKKYDESELVKKSSKNMGLKVAYINQNFKSLKIVEDIIENSFNILPTTSSLGFALLCEKIKKMKSKVVLTGVGGDELFFGVLRKFFCRHFIFQRK